MKSSRLSIAAVLLAAAFGAPVALAQSGTVADVKVVKQKGEGSGLGAVAGGVVGGVLGHQIGSGRGNTAATVVGAGAGAYAGHEIEKNQKSTTSHQVVVKLDNGNTRTFNFNSATSYKVGDKVRIVDGKLTRR